MIQRLKRKFIATNMLLVSLVLLAVFAAQVFSAYHQAAERVYHTQLQALEWIAHSSSPRFVFEGGPAMGRMPAADEEEPENIRQRRTQDLPGIPVFSVEIDGDGQVLSLRALPGVEVTQATAQAMVEEALAQAGDRGTIPEQRLSYLYQQENGRRFFAFVDNTSISDATRHQLLVSSLIVSGALLAFFLISWFLAKLSLRPVEAAWEQQRRFVADASHELKTPLTVALSNVDMLSQSGGLQGEKERRRLDITKVELLRMRELVEDLLTLARADAKPSVPAGDAMDTVDLSYLTSCAISALEPAFYDCGKRLESRVQPGLAVRGDAARLRELVDILLDNARKYSDAHSTVSIALSQEEKQIQLAIANVGKPISPEEQKHLFERFYRLDQSRGEVPGFGLGLSIAQEIVAYHHGRIWVESSALGKTVFHVEFPPQSKLNRPLSLLDNAPQSKKAVCAAHPEQRRP